MFYGLNMELLCVSSLVCRKHILFCKNHKETAIQNITTNCQLKPYPKQGFIQSNWIESFFGYFAKKFGSVGKQNKGGKLSFL